jgi:hypothetical protein
LFEHPPPLDHIVVHTQLKRQELSQRGLVFV